MSINSDNPAVSKSASKPATLSGSTQPKPLLYLDQLDVDVTGIIVVMIGRGNMIHCIAKSSVAHNFLRMKEGGIYSVKNFVVLPNKDEFQIFRHDRFMIEFDGETSTRKVSANPHGFLRYPFRLIEFDQVEPAHNKYLIDIAEYVTNVGRTTYTKSGSKTLEFYLENQRGQSLRVTLWGDLGDVLVEKKTRHVGVYAMVLTGMSGKEYNNKVYLSSTSSTVFCDDDDIPCLQELRADDSRAAPNKAPLPIDCTQPRERTLENLLIWARNRQNNVMIENFQTKKGWNYPSRGYEKCRKGASRKNGKWVCEVCNKAVDYLVFRYKLEVVVADDMAHTVVVMFNDTATELLKCSTELLMGMEVEGSDADDDLNLPLAIRNLIRTTHVLEIKSHTYYEYGTFESFNCWKINPSEIAEDDASSSTPAITANDPELSKKIVPKPPTVCTPLKINEARKQKGHDMEDSDVDEVCGPFAKKGTSGPDVAVDTKKKMNRGLLQNPVTIHANTIVRPDGRVQMLHNNQNITPSLPDLLQYPVSTHVNTIIAQDERIESTINIASCNNQIMTPSFTDLLQNSVRIDAHTIIRQDGRLQSYCGLRLTETTTDYLGINPLPLPDSTRLRTTNIAGPSTSKYASTRLPRRSAGPTHLRKAKKGSKKAAFTTTGVPVTYHNIGPPTHRCRNCNATMWYEEREENSKKAVNPTFSLCCQRGKVLLPRFHDTPPPLNHLLSHDQPSIAKFREQIRVYNSMFCFTSFGAKIYHSIYTGRAPYTFRINGQNYHRMGSLLPKEGMQPRFSQLYFFDTQNEVKNRTSAFIDKETSEGVDKHIVGNLISMLDQYSPVSQAFRMARDWCNTHNSPDFRLRLHSERKTTRDAHPTRDIIVERKDTGPQRVLELHPSYMALYYIIHQRPNQGNTLLKGGRLFQQYLVNAYTAVEEQRLKWTRNNQDTLRVDLYHNLCDAVTRGDTSAVGLGKRIVLLSTFTGSPGYMMNNYQDAMALCRAHDNPDLFITFTSNPKWPKISEMLAYFPGQKPHDRPEIGTRVFKIKLTELLHDLTQKHVFGESRAVVYVIEFQKCGLPHAHILLWLKEKSKCKTPGEVDDIISAEMPSPTTDPDGYKVVTDYMLHGPCGKDARNAACTSDGKCSKHFPKPFLAETFLDEDGYPHYRRRDNKFELNKRDPDARTLTYAFIPKHYVWHEQSKLWKKRKQRKCIGRIVYSSPASGERYYLRMLLNVVRGVFGFEELMTVNKRVCATFKEACFGYGLLHDDKEWSHAIAEASLRPQKIWEESWQILFEDILAKKRIASLLLPAGRTAHSRFVILLELMENSTCGINQNTQLAELMQEVQLIIWDEAPMTQRYAFEALDTTQILPVIPQDKRPKIVQACINRSELWRHCKVLAVGDGTLPVKMKEGEDEPTWIDIPEKFLIKMWDCPIRKIVEETYPDFTSR
ncbi:DNA helicase PIF1, ATP-dependent [Tanacetum coccineum]